MERWKKGKLRGQSSPNRKGDEERIGRVLYFGESLHIFPQRKGLLKIPRGVDGAGTFVMPST